MITEAGKSKGSRSVGWVGTQETQRASSMVTVPKPANLRLRKSPCFGGNSRAGEYPVQRLSGRSNSLTGRNVSLFVLSCLQLLDEANYLWPSQAAHKINHHNISNQIFVEKQHSSSIHPSSHHFPCCFLVRGVSINWHPSGYSVNTPQYTWASWVESILSGQFLWCVVVEYFHITLEYNVDTV